METTETERHKIPSLTPWLMVDDAKAAIDFYVRAFGAVEAKRINDKEGRIWNSLLQIGDSILVVKDSVPQVGPPKVQSLFRLSVDNVEVAWKRALDAGARGATPIQNVPLIRGRFGTVIDPWGNWWMIYERDAVPERAQKAV